MVGITKIVDPMFAEIKRLETLDNVTIEGVDSIPKENRITKGERRLKLSFETVLNKELHKVMDNPSFGRFFIHSNDRTFEVEENQAFFEGYNFMVNEPQTFSMLISALKDVKESKGYMRMAIPITGNYWVHNLHTFAIETERIHGGGLMVLNFDEGEVHVFTVTDAQTKKQYMVVEPQYEVTRDILFNIHYAVATGLGLITGTAYFGEAYVLVGDDLRFESYHAVSYYSLRENIHSQYTTFTTNMFWVEMLLKQGRYNKYALDLVTDEKGEVKRGLVDWLHEETYGQIIVNMYRYPEFARAAMILIDGTDKALDY